MYYKIFALLFLHLCFAHCAESAPIRFWDSGEKALEKHTRFFGVADGVFDGTIRAVCESRDGSIWFAGKQGVARYDGFDWTVDILDAPELIDVREDVNAILEAQDGSIWIGTNKGVAQYKDGIWRAFTQADGLPGPTVKTVYETRDGHIWVGCGTYYWQAEIPPGGVAFWDGQTWQTFAKDEGLIHDHANVIFETQDGIVWVGTDGGAGFFDGKRWQAYTTSDGLLHNRVLSIYQDFEGALWFGTEDSTRANAGISQLADGRWSSFKLAIEKWGTASIKQTQDGIIWALVDLSLYRFDGQMWQPSGFKAVGKDYVNNIHITTDEIIWLPGDVITRCDYGKKWQSYKRNVLGPPYEDASGTLWFVNAEGGTYSFKHDAWVSHPDIYWPVFVDTRGIRWSNSPRGLMALDGNIPTYHQGHLDTVKAISQTNDGRLWFVGQHQGESVVATYQHDNWTIYEEEDWGEGVTLSHTMLEGSDGNIWFQPYFGSRLLGFGVVQFDLKTNTWHHHLMSQEVGSNRIYDISFDTGGKVWVGALNGLWSFDGMQWTKDAYVGSRKVVDILHTKSGDQWIATASKSGVKSGALKHRNGIWTEFTERDGLVNNNVWRIHETSSGNLWMGTYGGASKYNGSIWQSISTQDGLFMNTIRYIHEEPSGALWFGRGYHFKNSSSWWATRYTPDLDEPETRFTFLPSKQLSTGNLIVEWTGIDKWKDTQTQNLEYSWQLDDLAWTPFDKQTKAALVDQGSGSHSFRVRAKDADGNIDTSPAEFQFYVIPPIWAQPWFVGLMVMFLGIIGHLSYRVVKRGQDLATSNKALSDANKQLFNVNKNLRNEISERDRLDTQIRDLQFLYSLRASLGEKQTSQAVINAVGNAVADVLRSDGGVVIVLDEQAFEFGQTSLATSYKRVLSWGERDRGYLHLYCSFALSESQERTLLDETSGQLARVLEARELQMQLLQSARLVSLGQMAAGVAHELNQPLGGISATAEDYYLRLQGSMAVSEDQIKRSYKRILDLVDRMASTVEHLRIFSRDTSDEPGAKIYINEIIESSLDLIGTQLSNHNIDVVCDFDIDLPRIIGHPYQLEQIFLNLLGNARDALQAKSLETDFSKEITLKTRRDGDHVVGEVRDNGIGIGQENLGHIFEPFFTTKSADKGTGLGLAITYAIVKNHGGQITCTSVLNQSTTFEVKFPISG